MSGLLATIQQGHQRVSALVSQLSFGQHGCLEREPNGNSWLRIRVYTEGVKSEAALEFLRSVECDYAQGYYVSKPIPAVDMTGMLHDWERGVARRPRAAAQRWEFDRCTNPVGATSICSTSIKN